MTLKLDNTDLTKKKTRKKNIYICLNDYDI